LSKNEPRVLIKNISVVLVASLNTAIDNMLLLVPLPRRSMFQTHATSKLSAYGLCLLRYG